MATTSLPPISTFSQALETRAIECMDKISEWNSLTDRSKIASEKCDAFLDLQRLDCEPPAALLKKLQPVIEECAQIQTAERAGRIWKNKRSEIQCAPMQEGMSETYKTTAATAQMALELLEGRAQKMFDARLCPAWEATKTVLERALTEAGVPAGIVGSIQDSLPKVLGGTWTRVNAKLNEVREGWEKAASEAGKGSEPLASVTLLSAAEEEQNLINVLRKIQMMLEFPVRPPMAVNRSFLSAAATPKASVTQPPLPKGAKPNETLTKK